MTKEERKLKKLKKKIKHSKYDQHSRKRDSDEYGDVEKEIKDLERQYKKDLRRADRS